MVSRATVQDVPVVPRVAMCGVRALHSTPPSQAGHGAIKHFDTEDNNSETEFKFDEVSMMKVERCLAEYPPNYKKSGIIPILWIAQKQHGGWLPLAAMNETARICEVQPIAVYEVATFYTMFNRKKIGKYNLQMCTTTPCMVLGAYDVLDKIKDHLSIHTGGDSEDMQFHLMEVECLGACANAPMMQISHAGGDDYFEDLTAENVVPILDAYQKDTPPRCTHHHEWWDGKEEFTTGAGSYTNGEVRAGPQPNGPQGHKGQRAGCEGPMGKTSLIEPPRGPYAPHLTA